MLLLLRPSIARNSIRFNTLLLARSQMDGMLLHRRVIIMLTLLEEMNKNKTNRSLVTTIINDLVRKQSDSIKVTGTARYQCRAMTGTNRCCTGSRQQN
jgi:hypothetical protein